MADLLQMRQYMQHLETQILADPEFAEPFKRA